ncbi:MAG: membrane protein [Acidobacteriaceae bacterium]
MVTEMVSWLLAIPLLGFATGLRTMTPIAVLCWYAWMHTYEVQGTWAFWTAKFVTVIVFTVLAAGELIGDKLPKTPNRIAPGPLVARLAFGGLVGAIAALALQGPGLEGVVLGVIGAAIGAFVGFMLRRHLVSSFECADWKIALPEDLIAIVAAIFAAHVVTN